MKLTFSVLALASLFSLSACKKEVTEIRQVNQAFSARYDIFPAQWTATTDAPGYYVTLPVAEIDDLIVHNGAVIVYLSFNDGDTYEAIPEVYGIISYGSIHVNGEVTIDMHATDGGPIDAPTKKIVAKIVLIDAEGLPS